MREVQSGRSWHGNGSGSWPSGPEDRQCDGAAIVQVCGVGSPVRAQTAAAGQAPKDLVVVLGEVDPGGGVVAVAVGVLACGFRAVALGVAHRRTRRLAHDGDDGGRDGRGEQRGRQLGVHQVRRVDRRGQGAGLGVRRSEVDTRSSRRGRRSAERWGGVVAATSRHDGGEVSGGIGCVSGRCGSRQWRMPVS